MARKSRDRLELAKASEHLHYEIGMLTDTAVCLNKGIPELETISASGRAHAEIIKNALLESFVLHARALADFFYNDSPRPDDVVAADYVSDWAKRRATESPLLQGLRSRAGKEIAHLTFGRLLVKDVAKDWSFADITKEMRCLLIAFLQEVSDAQLSIGMKQEKAAVEKDGVPR